MSALSLRSSSGSVVRRPGTGDRYLQIDSRLRTSKRDLSTWSSTLIYAYISAHEARSVRALRSESIIKVNSVPELFCFWAKLYEVGYICRSISGPRPQLVAGRGGRDPLRRSPQAGTFLFLSVCRVLLFYSRIPRQHHRFIIHDRHL